MSRYKAYPEYKATNHGWLNTIPFHWKMLPLKYLTASKVTDGPHETPAFITDGIPFLSVDGIQNNKLVFEGCRYISPEDHERYSVKCKPNNGDVLLGKAASVGKVAYVDADVEFNVWSPLAVIKPQCKKTGKFIYDSFQSALLQMQCDMYSNANTQKNLGMNTIDNLSLACPTEDEAVTIANFLDHETAKIDALIEKQQRLIELLKEKRQAVISHAVTKGLNPKAPMKDSGVEWLGEVPTHWHVTKLGWICEFISYGFTNPMPTTDEGPYMLTAADIEFGRVNYEEARMTSEDAYRNTLSAKSRPIDGDLLLTKDGTLGRVTVFDGIHAACISQSIALLRLVQQKVAPEFLSTALMGGDYQRKIILDAGGTTIKHIYISILAKMNIALPEIEEQHEIVSALKSKLSQIDQLINSAQSVSALLQERRTALISAAVTGKIDVRDWQAAA